MFQSDRLAHNIPAPDIALAERLFDELARETRDVRGVTRDAFGAGEQFAHDLIGREAAALGLDVRVDAAGNLNLRLPGAANTGRSVVIGSHLDSVPMGGNFDGAAGVLSGLAIAAGWKNAGFQLTDDLLVLAMRAEESNWFPHSYIGSKTALGLLPPEALEIPRSDTGRTLAEHMSELGCDVDRVRAGEPQIDPASIRAFVELHIEQGPVLIDADLPVAVVTGIRGSTRYREARIVGQYAHSGAVPLTYRQDAVLAAADLVMRLHSDWLRFEAEGHDMSATVGQFFTDAAEHAFSKISGQVDLSIDVRSHEVTILEAMHDLCLRHFAEIEALHRVKVEAGTRTGSAPALMDGFLVEAFQASQEAAGLPRFTMTSGAGHDAATFAGAGVPSVMLFVRNQNGSHNPDEAMEISDFEIATRVIAHGLAMLPS